MTNFNFARYAGGNLYKNFAHMKREYKVRDAMGFVILPEDRERMEIDRLLAKVHPQNPEVYWSMLQYGPIDYRASGPLPSIFFYEEDHEAYEAFAAGKPGTWTKVGHYTFPLEEGLAYITRWDAETHKDVCSVVWISHVEWDKENREWDFCVNEF